MAFQEEIKKIFLISICATIFLMVLKVAFGLFFSSLALVYDGIESAADIFIFLTLYGASILALKPPDKDHQYGHSKIENLAALFLGLLIFTGGIYLAFNAFSHLSTKNQSIPHIASFFVAVSVVLTKEALYFITKKKALETKSPIVEALAIDHHKDALSSLVTVAGTASSFLKFPLLDRLAALITAGVISVIGLKTAFDSSSDLLDRSPDTATIEKIKSVVLSVSGVKDIVRLKARKSGRIIYVDVDIRVDGELTVDKAHEIATKVQEETEKNIHNVKGVTVHVEPYKKN